MPLLGRAMSVELVYPEVVDAAKFKISIFSSLEASISGYSQGDEFVWEEWQKQVFN